jgi:hydroxymethylbilane synthase
MNELPRSALVLGSRTSPLALWQTHHVVQLLQAAWPGLACSVRDFVTTGDKSLDRPLPEIGGKGLFTAELEDALRRGEIDVAVHSLKDLPVEDAPGLTIGAIPARANVQDALVAPAGRTLATLPAGAVVGTSSIRRQAQILAARPDLKIRSIRGNVETRLRKALAGEEYAATLLAAAGLERLGLAGHVTEWLPLNLMLPAPGQGALAVQCRAGDTAVLALLAAVEQAAVRAAVTAERAFLTAMGGGCAAPVAAYAWPDQAGVLLMTALVAHPDGRHAIHVRGSGSDPHDLARKLAAQAYEQGAGQILAALKHEEASGISDEG